MSMSTTMSNGTKPTALKTKQKNRLEMKKKKISAFLAIAKLNEQDRFDSKKAEDDGEPALKRAKTDIDEMGKNKNKWSKQFDKADETSKEYADLKEEAKQLVSTKKKNPRFILKPVGDKASLILNQEDRIPIFLSDIQHLLLYSQVGVHSPYSPNRWCQLTFHNHISETVVLVIENASLYHYSGYETLNISLNKYFFDKVEIITPVAYGGSVLRELVTVPLTNTQRSNLIKKYGSLQAAMKITGEVFQMLRAVFPIALDENGEKKTEVSVVEYAGMLPPTDKFPRTSLLLSAVQMVEENYPLPLKGELSERYADYVLTKDNYAPVNAFSPMFGLDCEMCRTTSNALELTRISMVNEKLETIYEKFVKPDNPITDYLTRFSGMTKKMLDGVTTRLADVQEDLRKMLPPDAILVGQSLNFDLHTLKMMHPYVIDTSIIFNISGDRTRKTKLQTLARQYLDERIQESRKGHCSVEDSKASLKLAQLKLTKTVQFGDAVLKGRAAMDAKCTSEYATSIFKHLTVSKDRGRKALVVAPSETLEEYSAFVQSAAVTCESVTGDSAEVVKALCEKRNDFSFTLGHLVLKQNDLDSTNAASTLCELNKWVESIYESLTPRGLMVVIFSGQHEGSSGVGFISVKKESKC